MTYVPAPGYQSVFNPPVPLTYPICGGLRSGTSVYIQGTASSHSQRFAVNFACGQYEGPDIAFHFNPRFDHGTVVFNTFQCGSWCPEEVKHGGFPFQRGGQFELSFLVKPEGYQVNVNGCYFYQYRHRIPLERVQYIHLCGDLSSLQSFALTREGGCMEGILQCQVHYPAERGHGHQGHHYHEGGLSSSSSSVRSDQTDSPSLPTGVTEPRVPMALTPDHQVSFLAALLVPISDNKLPVMGDPVYNPPVPYYGTIPGGLCPKRTVVVRGSLLAGAQGFNIDFRVSSSTDIPLHFNPRLNQNSVVRNSHLKGGWGPEELSLPFNPFLPGQYFDISIRCGNYRYKIYVNGQHFCDYAHRFTELHRIDQLHIGGNVVLSLVQF